MNRAHYQEQPWELPYHNMLLALNKRVNEIKQIIDREGLQAHLELCRLEIQEYIKELKRFESVNLSEQIARLQAIGTEISQGCHDKIKKINEKNDFAAQHAIDVSREFESMISADEEASKLVDRMNIPDEISDARMRYNLNYQENVQRVNELASRSHQDFSPLLTELENRQREYNIKSINTQFTAIKNNLAAFADEKNIERIKYEQFSECKDEFISRCAKYKGLLADLQKETGSKFPSQIKAIEDQQPKTLKKLEDNEKRVFLEIFDITVFWKEVEETSKPLLEGGHSKTQHIEKLTQLKSYLEARFTEDCEKIEKKTTNSQSKISEIQAPKDRIIQTINGRIAALAEEVNQFRKPENFSSDAIEKLNQYIEEKKAKLKGSILPAFLFSRTTLQQKNVAIKLLNSWNIERLEKAELLRNRVEVGLPMVTESDRQVIADDPTLFDISMGLLQVYQTPENFKSSNKVDIRQTQIANSK